MTGTKFCKFAFILSNFHHSATYNIDLHIAIGEIEKRVRKKGDLSFRIKAIKTTSPGRSVLSVETSVLTEISFLADAVHEIFPRHGIAVLPWETVEIK